MHDTSLRKMSAFVEEHLDDSQKLKILDVGSYDVNGSYKPFFLKDEWDYTGCDLEDGPNVDFILESPYDWSDIESESYDVIISGQAFEHIEFFWVTICEMRRVLKKDGLICLIAPSGGMEHRYPVDCWRFYPDGFRTIAKIADLEVLDVYTEWKVGMWSDSYMVCRKNSCDNDFNKWKRKQIQAITSDEVMKKRYEDENSLREERDELKKLVSKMRGTKRWRIFDRVNKIFSYKQNQN